MEAKKITFRRIVKRQPRIAHDSRILELPTGLQTIVV